MIKLKGLVVVVTATPFDAIVNTLVSDIAEPPL
jgi:hypothetical protein